MLFPLDDLQAMGATNSTLDDVVTDTCRRLNLAMLRDSYA